MNPKLKHLKLERTLCVLDLESTGVDPSRDRIVEIAVLKVAPDGSGETFHTLVNPGMPIPAAARNVHGISDADVERAPSFAAIAPPLDRFLSGSDLAGFGLARFDLPLLGAEFRRAGLRFGVIGRNVLDALAVYHRREPRDLAAAVAFYLGRPHSHAHTATADVRAALEVLDRQIGRYALPATPARVHAELVAVDVAGRFARGPDGSVRFAFGKHAGRPLEEVARRDAGYLRWMLDQPFLDDVRGLVHQALAGHKSDVRGGDRPRLPER